jgi:hypothetical protein
VEAYDAGASAPDAETERGIADVGQTVLAGAALRANGEAGGAPPRRQKRDFRARACAGVTRANRARVKFWRETQLPVVDGRSM